MLRNTYNCSDILSDDFSTIFNNWMSYYDSNVNVDDPSSL